jgi:predicted DNA-binding transcriptional regulator AlpA
LQKKSTPARGDVSDLRLLRKSEVLALLGVTAGTLTEWVRNGHFPPPLRTAKGAPHRWRERTVAQWMTKCERSRLGRQKARGFMASKDAD